MPILLSGGTIQESGGRVVLPANFFAPTLPAFHAYRNAGHVPVSTQVVFNATALNRGNHFNTSNGFFTAPIAGPYWFYFWGMHSGTTLFNNQYVRMQRNSSGTNELRIYTSMNVAARTAISGGMIYRMNAGDTMRIFNENVNQLYGTSNVYCYFLGCYLG
jgi:hypothetical protein